MRIIKKERNRVSVRIQETGGEAAETGERRRQVHKTLANNADLCYEIKHGGHFGGIG